MTLKYVLETMDTLDDPRAGGEAVKELFARYGWREVSVERVEGAHGTTDFVKIIFQGSGGKRAGKEAPTTGVIGRLGGVGARPTQIGLVSDADGAVAALATALKLADMRRRGDVLPGDVIVATHVCPDAPVQPHEPVPFMGSPVDMATMNRMEVDPAMDAILSIDATKGNRVINHRGVAISPTVKEGYILRVSEDLLRLYEAVAGIAPVVFPITTQDITPYGNGLFHLNSIVQPATATTAPVVGIAVTAVAAVPGSATGANHETDIALAARYAIEVAKAVGAGTCRFYDVDEWRRIQELYGAQTHLQTLGRQAHTSGA
jgi:hypothetical protein